MLPECLPIAHRLFEDTRFATIILRYMLENEYELKVSHLRLGVLHPLTPGPVCVEIPRMEAEIALIVAHELAS